MFVWHGLGIYAALDEVAWYQHDADREVFVQDSQDSTRELIEPLNVLECHMSKIEQVSKEEVARTVKIAVERQIRGQTSYAEAEKQWAKMLGHMPAGMVAEALAIELATGRYQVVPTCKCCGR